MTTAVKKPNHANNDERTGRGGRPPKDNKTWADRAGLNGRGNGSSQRLGDFMPGRLVADSDQHPVLAEITDMKDRYGFAKVIESLNGDGENYPQPGQKVMLARGAVTKLREIGFDEENSIIVVDVHLNRDEEKRKDTKWFSTFVLTSDTKDKGLRVEPKILRAEITNLGYDFGFAEATNVVSGDVNLESGNGVFLFNTASSPLMETDWAPGSIVQLKVTLNKGTPDQCENHRFVAIKACLDESLVDPECRRISQTASKAVKDMLKIRRQVAETAKRWKQVDPGLADAEAQEIKQDLLAAFNAADSDACLEQIDLLEARIIQIQDQKEAPAVVLEAVHGLDDLFQPDTLTE